MIQHHPSLELLTDYCSGGMRLSHSLCVASHLEYCETCRKQVKKLEKVGALYFEESPRNISGEKDKQLKDRVFSLLDEDERDMETLKPISAEVNHTDNYRAPNSLAQFVQGSFNNLDWSRITPSIKLATLCHDRDGSQIALSCVRPGGKLPHHRHTGGEITVVLEGSFSDESGIFSKGDFVYRDASHKHKPVVTKDAECICLMVLDAPIKFTGIFSRLLNPLVKRHHASSATIDR